MITADLVRKAAAGGQILPSTAENIAAFLGAGLWGLRSDASIKSARATFLVSLVYLVGLFAAIGCWAR